MVGDNLTDQGIEALKKGQKVKARNLFGLGFLMNSSALNGS